MQKKAFTLIELLVVIAIIAILAAILFPVFAQAKLAAKRSASLSNIKQISLASVMYSADYDDMIVVNYDEDFNALTNTAKDNSGYQGKQRADAWTLLLLPYVKSIGMYIDPTRGDTVGIWKSAALKIGDAGYNAGTNTFRNQNRFPMYGSNYMYCTPIITNLSDPAFPLWGEARSQTQATDPAGTIMFADSARWTDTTRGWFDVNAPGMWDAMSPDTVAYIIWWFGTDCSGDWCGKVTDPLARTANFYSAGSGGGNVAFLDSHAKYLKAGAAAAGTNFANADVGGLLDGGHSQITDKTKYLWNLDENYYGAA